MSVQIGRRKRWVPGPQAKIDWSHPLAAGLVFCAVGGRDLVSGQSLAIPSALVPTPFGSGRAGVAGTTTPYVPTLSVPTGAHSFFAVGAYGPVAGYQGLVGFGQSAKGSGLLYDATNGRLSLLFRAVAVYDVFTGGLSHTVVRTAGASVTGNGGTVTGWINGVQGSTVAVGTMLSSSSAMGHVIMGTDPGAGAVNTLAASGSLVIACTWARTTTGAEHAALAADPFCFLRTKG